MQMTLRWHTSSSDTGILRKIRQIPGVSGVVSTLYDMKPGDVWPQNRIHSLKEEITSAGLELSGIESVNVHEAIKAGILEREQYIDHYIETLENLGKENIHLVCYRFMPVFDRTLTDPFASYKGIDEEIMFDNLCYFLLAVMPVCNKYDIRMAIHPDDPAWSMSGLPGIIPYKQNIIRLMNAVDDVHNGVAFCTGSYGTNIRNSLTDMIRILQGRIHFVHVSSPKYHSQDDFEESAYLSGDGNDDMYEIMKTLYEIGFDGPICPDHGRTIWEETAKPGYGFYDRALGAVYLNGLWEAIDKQHKRGE